MKSYSIENRYFNFEKKIKSFIVRLTIFYSRILAKRYTREFIEKKGESVINRKLKKNIKQYCKERFGSSGYFPWIVLYTEVRGEFIKGWLPYDYFRYIMLPKINPPEYCDISEQKTFDYRLFGDFAIRPLYLYISGMFYDSDFQYVENSQVIKNLAAYNDTIVIKEERGTKGKQVKIIQSSEFNPELLLKNINYIIQPYILQYYILESLHPESVNTFRVTTYLKTNGSVDIKFVVLRFGVDGSKIDNISSGGQYIYFDSEGKPSKYAYDIDGFVRGDRHKNTGFIFSNLQIPMFNDILNKCKNAHKKYPYTRLIGWDVCINALGEPKLVEWNAGNPGFWFWEDVLGPFWTNDEEIFQLI